MNDLFIISYDGDKRMLTFFLVLYIESRLLAVTQLAK